MTLRLRQPCGAPEHARYTSKLQGTLFLLYRHLMEYQQSNTRPQDIRFLGTRCHTILWVKAQLRHTECWIVIRSGLNAKSRVVIDDALADPRFSSAAEGMQRRSIICLPISSNRGQTFGLVYISSNYSFPQTTVQVLTLLVQQASISIANAMLFRSVQAGTRENLKMIASQRAALEQARRSREDALKATKVSDIFSTVSLTLK